VDRIILDSLKTDSLENAQLSVVRGSEVRTYQLLSQLPHGKTAAAWKASDSLGKLYAIKFALKGEYDSHSLEAEISRVYRLATPLIAKIDYYGTPNAACDEIPWSELYAIIVDWVDGISLKKYLAENGNEVTLDEFRQFAHDLCEILASLREHDLVHNDLHDRNLLVVKQRSALTGAATLRIVAIDTGQLKLVERQSAILDSWRNQLATLRDLSDSTPLCVSKQARLEELIDVFGRTDHECVVGHLCSFHNSLNCGAAQTDLRTRRFLDELPAVLQLAIDSDASRRVDDPKALFDLLEAKVPSSFAVDQPSMGSPFDLPSAELIRSDRQLMELFSEEYPRLDECRSNAPVYIYGPRGCGKSTLLRSMSLKALLSSHDPVAALSQNQFIGVYLSCSSELRSRFLLFPEEAYVALEASIVRYFTLLLVEALSTTFDYILSWDVGRSAEPRFGMTDALAVKCCQIISERLELPSDATRYLGSSPFAHLSAQLRRVRDSLWKDILSRRSSATLPDAQAIFDIVKELEQLCPFLAERRVAFLLDDYSNQRIPAELQRRLNQTITFAKQGSPIFKVSSEYYGVDLAGIQEGREVREINIGSEYVRLRGRKRWQFLRTMLERRFDYLKAPVDMTMVLSLSGMEPAISMAREIAAANREKRKFHYFGLDTVSDVCSGDFATGLDVVRRIFEHGHVNWRNPSPVAPSIQHDAITEYAAREFDYIRYRSADGQKKYEIVDRLCWLSHKAAIDHTRKKGDENVPVVKNHFDISESAMAELLRHSKHAGLFDDLVRKGILFPLDASRSRESHDGTRRYMVRRIFLTRYNAPLGRDNPIRIDTLERLRLLLTEPREFVAAELASMGNGVSTAPAANQKDFDW
jgi:tRNA A-37 threonylcarbamoyl transferase component Bud32